MAIPRQQERTRQLAFTTPDARIAVGSIRHSMSDATLEAIENSWLRGVKPIAALVRLADPACRKRNSPASTMPMTFDGMPER